MALDLNNVRVLGVLAGRDLPSERVTDWAKTAEIVLAADGGANLLFERGFIPNAVIGDFDSIADSTKDMQQILIHTPDQNQTDCDKLLAYTAESGYKRITLCGIEGDFVDHLLGTLQSAAKSKLEIRLVTRRGVVHLLRGPNSYAFNVPLGARLSLLPITDCSGVELTGSEWTLSDAELSPVGLSSLSNRVLGNVDVAISSGTAAIFFAHPTLEIPHWDY